MSLSNQDDYGGKNVTMKTEFCTICICYFFIFLYISQVFLSYRRRCKHKSFFQFVEDLEGVELISDDFLIVGFGGMSEEVDQNSERNERAFLGKCREPRVEYRGGGGCNGIRHD